MCKTLVFVTIVSLAVGSFFTSCVKKVPEKIVWNQSFDQGLKLAQDEGKNLMVDFDKEDCPWCKRLQDSTFTDKDVIKLFLDFVFVKLDKIKDSVLVSEYGVNAYPTVILFDTNGEEIDRIVGYFPPREFLKTVKSYLKGEGTLTDLEEKLATDSSNVELLIQLGEKYQYRDKYKEALIHYQNIVSLDPENKLEKTDTALFSIAMVYLRQEDRQAAIDRLKGLVQSFPESKLRLDAEEYIPYIYARMGDTTTALRLYEKLLVDYPDLETDEKEWVDKQIKKLTE